MTEHPTTDARSNDPETPRRAELYLRGDTHGGLGAQQVVERLDRLEADDTFEASVLVSEWHRWHTQDGGRRPPAMETYETFRLWAEENGFSLEPGFQQRTRGFLGLDAVEDVVVFPVVALAVYDEDRLRAVFPCTDESRTYTVGDALAAFERGDEDWLSRFDPIAADYAGSRHVRERLIAD